MTRREKCPEKTPESALFKVVGVTVIRLLRLGLIRLVSKIGVELDSLVR